MFNVRLEVPVTGTQSVCASGDTLEEVADSILQGRGEWGYVDVDGVDATKEDIVKVLQDMVSQGDLVEEHE